MKVPTAAWRKVGGQGRGGGQTLGQLEMRKRMEVRGSAGNKEPCAPKSIPRAVANRITYVAQSNPKDAVSREPEILPGYLVEARNALRDPIREEALDRHDHVRMRSLAPSDIHV